MIASLAKREVSRPQILVNRSGLAFLAALAFLIGPAMAPTPKPLRTRRRKKATPVPDDLKTAMVYLAEVCGRLEDGWSFPPHGSVGEKTLEAARLLVAAQREDYQASIKKSDAKLAKALADVYSRRRQLLAAGDWEEEVAKAVEDHWYPLNDEQLALLTDPDEELLRLRGARICAADAAQRLLKVSARSLFTWSKLPEPPTRSVDRNAYAYRQLLAFLRALYSKTHWPQRSGLRSIEAQVLARLRRKESARKKR